MTPVPLTTLREPGSIVQPTHVAHSWPEPCRVGLPLSSAHNSTYNTQSSGHAECNIMYTPPPPPPPPKASMLKRTHKGAHTGRQIQYNEENPHGELIEIIQIELENKRTHYEGPFEAVTSHMDDLRPEKAQMTHTNICNIVMLTYIILLLLLLLC